MREMPGIAPFEYLIDLLTDLGICRADGGVSWQEIKAWREETFTSVSRWEVMLLKKLSALYYSSSRRYSGSSEGSPMIVGHQDPDEFGSDLKAAFRQVAKDGD